MTGIAAAGRRHQKPRRSNRIRPPELACKVASQQSRYK